MMREAKSTLYIVACKPLGFLVESCYQERESGDQNLIVTLSSSSSLLLVTKGPLTVTLLDNVHLL